MPKTRSIAPFTAAALALALAAGAETPKPVYEGDVVTVTGTIEAIDRTTRQISVKGEKGNYRTITVPPEVERFDAIKVGDVVTARYVESVLVRLVQPGQPAPADASLDVGVTPRAGEKPGGTIANQVSVKVKVQAVDKSASSLTVATPAGESVSLKVKDKKRLDKVKVGDEIEVTYTEALLLTVDPKKK